MNAIRIRTQIDQENSLVLRNLPLSKGRNVEVIILADDLIPEAIEANRFPLREKPLRYDDPFGSATGSSDWAAAR